MDPLYHEQIPAALAKQLLQDEFISGENMTYVMIAEISNTTILQHDNITGKDVEISLPNTQVHEEAPVPKIESYKGVYGEKGLSKFVIIQFAAIAGMALIAVAGICILYYIFR